MSETITETISITFGGSFQPYPGSGSGGGNGPGPLAPQAGPFSLINVTTPDGFHINGTPVLKVDAQNNVYVGPQSGNPNASGGLNACFGFLTGNALTTGDENTFIGYVSGQYVTTGSFLTGLGEHTLGCETTANFSVAVGNDSQRNVISTGSNVSVGKNSQYVHSGNNNTSIGMESMEGNSCAVILGGTATNGDVVSLTFTGSFTGSPQTISTTVTGGESLASIATALYNAFMANTALLNLSGFGSNSSVIDTSNIRFNWFQHAVGSVTVTSHVTGSATETVTILAGFTGTDNVAVGKFALQGYYFTSGVGNVAIGSNTLAKLQSGSNNVGVGTGSGSSLTTGHDNIFVGITTAPNATTAGFNIGIGSSALNGLTTGGTNTAVGFFAGKSITSGGGNVIIGQQVASATLTTGSNNIYIGGSGAIDATTGGENNTFRLGNHATNLIRATGINTATPAFFFDWFATSSSYANDAAAATGGVAVNQAYRNGSNLCFRVS